MFRKIVSNLAFSPALVGQLGFYAKRLRKEETTRRVGLIFTALALVIQLFAVFTPPESANAANGNNIIYGGFKDKNDLLAIYDRNQDSAGHKDLQQIYAQFGITRQDIVNGKWTTFNSLDKNNTIKSVGRSASYSWQRTPYKITNTSTTVYGSGLHKFDSGSWTSKHGSTYHAVVGKRAVDGQWFAIMSGCGNPAFVTLPPPPPKPPTPCPLNATLPKNSPDCKPCENDNKLWYKDEKCHSEFLFSKSVRNISQTITNANNTTAKPGDRLEYHLIVRNVGKTTGIYTVQDNLSDVVEYADIVDTGGGTIAKNDQTTPVEKANVISWPALSIKPGQTVEKIVGVQVKSMIPATPQSPGNLESYNCRMVNNFASNTTTVAVDCPSPKVVEQVVAELPHTGATENMAFAGIVLAVVVYFYARARQVKKEVRLVRRDLNAGTI